MLSWKLSRIYVDPRGSSRGQQGRDPFVVGNLVVVRAGEFIAAYFESRASNTILGNASLLDYGVMSFSTGFTTSRSSILTID